MFYQGMCFLGVPPTIEVHKQREKTCPLAILIITAT